MLRAPDTDPIVTPTTLARASGVWATLGAVAGIVVVVLPVLPTLPPEVQRWLPVVGAAAGFILNRRWNDSYRPSPEKIEP